MHYRLSPTIHGGAQCAMRHAQLKATFACSLHAVPELETTRTDPEATDPGSETANCPENITS